MEIQQIRLDNANRILGDLKINKAEFGRRMGKSPQNISGFLGINAKRNIGHNMAREIEATFNKPSGWLDKLDEHYPRQYKDNSCRAYLKRASQTATEYKVIRKEWIQNHRDALREVESDFRKWLSHINIELLPPVGRYDFSVSVGGSNQYSLNMFIPLPGFYRLNIPPFEAEQPDYISIALAPDREIDPVSYFVIAKHEYLELSRQLEIDHFDISVEKSYSSGGSVYLSLILESGENKIFQSKTIMQQKKLQRQPASMTVMRDFHLNESVAIPA